MTPAVECGGGRENALRGVSEHSCFGHVKSVCTRINESVPAAGSLQGEGDRGIRSLPAQKYRKGVEMQRADAGEIIGCRVPWHMRHGLRGWGLTRLETWRKYSVRKALSHRCPPWHDAELGGTILLVQQRSRMIPVGLR